MATHAQITNWDMYNGIDYQLMKLGFSLHCSIAHLTMVNGFTSGAGDCINALHIFFDHLRSLHLQMPQLFPRRLHNGSMSGLQNDILLNLVFGCKKSDGMCDE